MVDFLQACINGLLTGALYALIGMGLALIFGVMRIVNFAHGAFLMVGMYTSWVLFDKLKINPYIGFLAAGVFLFFFGYLVYLLLIQPIRDRSDFMQILMTTGIALILVDGVQLKFGADYHQTNIELVNRTLRFGPFAVNAAYLLSFAIAAVCIVSLRSFVVRSRTGQALRAIAQNREVAPLMGINVTRIQGLSFALGIAVAGVAGGLLLPALYLFPTVGDDYTLKAFVIVVLGGMGSIEGAAFGGLVLGVAESLTSFYIGNQWALIVDFVLFLLVLSLKPSGIFGRQRA
ncbi:MAG TPA: branched-chain amino acid ABC transporter permease [Candidatus Angelobacter sp.]|nr:branched-chain amino acid ABC transporter permease [Candidatus Angelobacter sp.]